jgi:hypothetical protein
MDLKKKEMADYGMRTFGNVPIGIHGRELAKFSETQNAKEYWKLRDGYKPFPSTTSNLELRQTQKYWAKPDRMLLSDGNEGEAPRDPFKMTYVPCERKVDLAEKVQHVNRFQSEPGELGGVNVALTQPRWTEVMQRILQKHSIYDEDPTQRPSILKSELEPLPSSFSKTGIFQDPSDSLRLK